MTQITAKFSKMTEKPLTDYVLRTNIALRLRGASLQPRDDKGRVAAVICCICHALVPALWFNHMLEVGVCKHCQVITRVQVQVRDTKDYTHKEYVIYADSVWCCG